MTQRSFIHIHRRRPVLWGRPHRRTLLIVGPSDHRNTSVGTAILTLAAIAALATLSFSWIAALSILSAGLVFASIAGLIDLHKAKKSSDHSAPAQEEEEVPLKAPTDTKPKPAPAPTSPSVTPEETPEAGTTVTSPTKLVS